MLVGGPQLDAVELRLGQVLDDRRQIPVLRDVVGHGAESKAVPRLRRSGRLIALDPGGYGEERRAREEGSSVHVRELTHLASISANGRYLSDTGV